MTQLTSQQEDTGRIVRLGGWLFRRRTALPVPIAIALLIAADRTAPAGTVWLGVSLVAAGEAVRLWAVHQIGAISRTRSDRLGPLVQRGPFAYVRNPLYLGNLALWTGFTVSAGLLPLVPAVIVLLAFQYHAIVRWEERLLAQRHGDAYRRYAAQVPRWLPRRAVIPPSKAPIGSRFSWRDTLFSERGTLIAIAAGYALLYVRRLV